MATTATARKTTKTTKTTKPRVTATTTKPAAKPAAQRAVNNGQAAATDASKALRTFMAEAGYAYVGAGDAAVAFVRSLPERTESLASTAGDRAKAIAPTPSKLQELAKESNERLIKLLEDTRSALTSQFDEYVVRGKKVVKSVRESAPTRRAVAQTKTARSQVKGAVTSVRKAANESAEAVEAAGNKVGATA